MIRTAPLITLLLTGAIGCATSDDRAPASEPATIVPASEQAARAVPGLAAWELRQLPDGAQALGVDAQHRILSRADIHLTTDAQGNRVVEIRSESPASGVLRLTQRDGQLVGHEMTGQPSAATGQLVSDLQASRADMPYDWLCAIATGAVIATCGAAILSAGAAVIIDEGCLEAFDLYVDTCGIAI